MYEFKILVRKKERSNFNHEKCIVDISKFSKITPNGVTFDNVTNCKNFEKDRTKNI